MAENPNYVCPLCKHADKGSTAWPCKLCKRVNEMKDYFEPNDDAPITRTVMPEDHTAEVAARLIEKFSINCGNCPATVLCMARYAEQPEAGDTNCLDAFAFWLRSDTNTNRR